MKIQSLCSFLFIAMLLLACDRNDEISGCTDHLAENHDPRATVDDGSCTYAAETQIIWKDGVMGGWNKNLTTHGFIPVICKGTMSVETDSTQTEVPALLVTDSNGELDLQFKLLNPMTIRHYMEGSVHVDLQKPSGSELNIFEIYLHGKVADSNGDCEEFMRCDRLQFSALALDSTTTTLSVPFTDFSQFYMGNVAVVFGLSVNGAAPNAEVLQINNIRWTRF